MRRVVVVALLLAVACRKEPARVSFYERLEDKLVADPKLASILGRPAAELAQVAWMVGEWTVTARVFKTARTPERIDRGDSVVEPALGGTWLVQRDSYRGANDDVGYLTFNPVTRKWISVNIDKTGNAAVSTADAWSGNRLVFLADLEIVGERVKLRQTIEKRSEREYRVLNEERLATGEWAALDEYVYVKK